ncbi:CPBP family intramembrane metalloprotease [bacterium AH-315-P15]|nr:CPBP family intramembrane metalloprotease [bacterium AH-315-P15]
MASTTSERREAWTAIITFLIIVTGLSAVFHYAIVNYMPTSLYVGPLMWSPAVAALITLRLRGRKISSLPWGWGKWRYNIGAFLVPVLYVAAAYALIWQFGLGGFPNEETLAEWAGDLGLEGVSSRTVILVMVLIMGTVGCIRAMSTIVGEEIGWRGFFIWELRKVMPFGGVAIFSGVIWALWHWPIVVFYGGGNPVLQMAAFTVMITAMSVILAYFTFKSNSLWPAVMFHAAHNVYFDKIFDPLTRYGENTSLWAGEYGGLMLPITASVLALYFWRKAKAEGL